LIPHLLAAVTVEVEEFPSLAVDFEHFDTHPIGEVGPFFHQAIDSPLGLAELTLQLGNVAGSCGIRLIRVPCGKGRLGFTYEGHQQKNTKQQNQYIDQGNEKPSHGATRQCNHDPPPTAGVSGGAGDAGVSGTIGKAEAGSPANARIKSRPVTVIQAGKIFAKAINRPLPVAVIAGAYRLMISCGVGCTPGANDPKVCKMAATVPSNPNNGNHSAAWAKCVSQRSGRSSKPPSAHRIALQARTVWVANSVNPKVMMTQSIADDDTRSK
jgi:hypothetical protein